MTQENRALKKPATSSVAISDTKLLRSHHEVAHQLAIGEQAVESAVADRAITELPEILDLKDVADLLRVHQKTIRLMALEGKIPAFRAGRLWRFKKTRILEWLDSAA